MKKSFEPAVVLTCFIILLSTVASAGGLFFPGLYRDDDFIKRAWFGSDVTTLFLVIPLLAIALRFSMQGSLRARLLWVGLLGYMLYNFAFYLFGAAFNNFFLVYTALFTASIYALIFGLSSLEVRTYHKRFSLKTPVKAISIFMIIICLPIAVFELSQVFTAMALGKKPAVPTLIFALDLSFIIPNMLLASILLLKRFAWGFILSAIMLVKGFTYGINLIISSASIARFRLSGDWDPLTPFYVFIAAGSFIAGWHLLKNLWVYE